MSLANNRQLHLIHFYWILLKLRLSADRPAESSFFCSLSYFQSTLIMSHIFSYHLSHTILRCCTFCIRPMWRSVPALSLRPCASSALDPKPIRRHPLDIQATDVPRKKRGKPPVLWGSILHCLRTSD
jgi:hypothetical protein